MPELTNLTSEIKKQLPDRVFDLIQLAGKIASERGQSLFLVGGMVRDLLLGKTNLDIDLVVEGDAADLAHALAQMGQGKITTHPHFGTAKIQWDEWSIDLATARSETYAKPGVLPSVKPDSIEKDLARRDFTINALAIRLGPDRFGELIDIYGGMGDIEHNLVRVLHDRSFIDDATRIWRALRYEQRLDFHIEANTLRLLERDTAMLDTVSGDRIRYELECVLKEQFPEKVLRRAEELGVLSELHPALRGDGWLAEKFDEARLMSLPDPPPMGIYLALMTYSLSSEESEQLIGYLRLPRALARVLRDAASIKSKMELLEDPGLAPSAIYHLLHGHFQQAIIACSLASDSPTARQNMHLFLSKLHYVKPSLTGDDLQRMGIPPSPRIKEILNMLREARLDGKAKSREDEEELVKKWIR